MDTASGAIATFPDGADNMPLEHLIVDIQPEQDLHGYDYPWPAGGGKNLLDYDTVYASCKTGENAFFGYNNPNDGPQYVTPLIDLSDFIGQQVTFSAYVTVGGETGSVFPVAIINGVQTTSGAVQVLNGNSGYISITVTPETENDLIKISYSSGRGNLTFNNIMLEVGPSRTNWSPYSNICPIVGKTGANANSSGLNILPPFENTTVWNANGYLNAAGNIISDSSYRTTCFIPVEENDKFFLSTSPKASDWKGICYYDENKKKIDFLQGTWQTSSFTAPQGTKYIRIYLKKLDYFPQLNKSASEVDFSLYSGQTIPIVFPAMGKNLVDIGTATFTGYKRYTLSEPLKPGTYTVSASVTSSDTDANVSLIGLYNTSSVSAGGGSGAISFNRGARESHTVTTIKDTNFIYLYASNSAISSTRKTATWADVQIESGSNATAYEPYTNTIYGASLDVVTGDLVVKWKAVDLGTANYTEGTATTLIQRFDTGTFTDIKRTIGGNDKYSAICSMFKAATYNETWVPWIFAPVTAASSVTIAFCTPPNKFQSVEDFKNYVSGTQFCYELATPITYHLTPQQVRTLLGLNNIWSDAGDVEVTYRADTDLFVQKKAIDIQINGTSILSNGVANVPVASTTTLGVVKVGSGLSASSGTLSTYYARSATIKGGANSTDPVTPSLQHEAVFYGLTKAAGVSMATSSNAVGTYTESAKSAISTMLNGAVSVSGSTPSITAKDGIQYICGECSTLTIVVPDSGTIDVIFESGSTPTVLTVTPPTGMTMKWMNDFDPDNLDANTTYEINIKNGCLGVAGKWT